MSWILTRCNRRVIFCTIAFLEFLNFRRIFELSRFWKMLKEFLSGFLIIVMWHNCHGDSFMKTVVSARHAANNIAAVQNAQMYDVLMKTSDSGEAGR